MIEKPPSMDNKCIFAHNRGILKVEGPDRHTFLQGLITQDINRLTQNCAVYSALLTPQGRYLYDFFMIEMNRAVYLDMEGNRIDELIKRFKLYKLRSQITLSDETDAWNVVLLLGDKAPPLFDLEAILGKTLFYQGGVIYVDPRLETLGLRCMVPKNFDLRSFEEKGFVQSDFSDYDRLRLSLGVPDGARDMVIEKAIPLEYGFDELHAIAWEKGCYLGQELTARTKYVGLVRKRLIPVTIMGESPLEFQAPIFLEGNKIGDLRSRNGNLAIALLRLEALEGVMSGGAKLQAGENFMIPHIPDWMKISFEESLKL